MEKKRFHRKTGDLSAYPDEVSHFEYIKKTIAAELHKAYSKVEQADKEYMDQKRYMADYRGELDPHEMFQNTLLLKQIDQTGAVKADVWRKLEKIKESPYFARIDFQEEKASISEPVYIGRFSFMSDYELLIIDWRSPMAGMFYDYELGPAEYNAPMGCMKGTLTRKRQFRITDGELDYVLESSQNIQDNLLQKVLSQNADDKMKSIISTIQKEQNQIIRNEKTKSMIIQGVAGSGKTSIALHRISFLLYRYKQELSGKNVAIISPNKVFGDYISTVLPELGEEPIYELNFTDIANLQLQGGMSFLSETDPLETQDEEWAERVRFKSTIDFVRQTEQYLCELSNRILTCEDYTYKQYRVSAAYIANRFRVYHTHSVKKRLKLIAEDIYEQLQDENKVGDKLPRPGVIVKTLNKMLKIKSTLALYKDFYNWLRLPQLLKFPDKKTMEWADVFPFLYFQAAYEGIQEGKYIKHLVIDEMQDYTPIQYAVINMMFPCQKTILGDFYQRVHPFCQHTIQDLLSLYKDAGFVELTKSYRSTYEIIMFAKSINDKVLIEAVERHGEQPLIIACRDTCERLAKIKELIKYFFRSEYETFGIILKTNTMACELYEQLSIDYDIHLITPESTSFHTGISITSIQMSKGLEFDEILVLDVNDEEFKTEYERNLLYIAVTRAMHKLTVLYTGRPSHYLDHQQ